MTTMKKFSSMLMLATAMLFAFTACKDDDSPGVDLGAPTIEASNDTYEQVPGESVNIQLTVEADAGITSIVASGDASGAVEFDEDKTSQTITYSFEVPADAEEAEEFSLTFTVTDKEGDTDAASVTVTATAEPTPVEGEELINHMVENMNVVADPGLAAVSRTAEGALDPRPSGDDITTDLAEYPSDAFFEAVSYKGAFDPTGDLWLMGWSTLHKYGYLAGTTAETEGPFDLSTANIVEVSGAITGDVTWTADNLYRLDGFVFVESGTLTIEPGTVVIAKTTPTTGDNTTSLIITREAKIMAEGTAEDPIIFTSEEDDGTLTEEDAGFWGGLIVLGKAKVYSDGATEAQIEGIPNDETRALHGGDDDAHSSGTIKYVSIRYSGSEISVGNEIQGLTLGSVGSGTEIDFVEVFACTDDGIEFFGGTVGVKHAAIAFVDDDSYDWDLGWRGNGQFWFAIQKEKANGDGGDHAGEWDGAVPDDAELYANGTIYNATFIGRGVDANRGDDAVAILMRDGTAGTLANSIITEFDGKGIEVEDTETVDSYGRIGDELHILNNIWHVGGNTTLDASATGIIKLTE